jgi:hypothetical protein
MIGKQQFLIDLAERVFFTFVQAFLGAFVITDLSTAKTAALAGVAAALAVLKGVAASMIGDRGTAALLPAGDVPPQG